MGTIRQGANGGFSGKAGSVVGSKWKDISYIKGLSKRRRGVASQLQLEAQAKFTSAVQGEYPDYSINYEAVQLAVGSLAIAMGSVTAEENTSLQVT